MDSVDTGAGKKTAPSNLKPNYLVCFYCQQPGHKASVCPLKTSKSVELCAVPRPDNDQSNINGTGMVPHKHVVEVTVNCNVAKALADTGSSQTLVKSNLLNNAHANFERSVNITCVHGCKKDYPTADVVIEVEGQAFLLTVGVLDHLAYDVILGEDLPILDNLVQQNSVAYACAVVTRSATKGLEPLPDADDGLYEGVGRVKKKNDNDARRRTDILAKVNVLNLLSL